MEGIVARSKKNKILSSVYVANLFLSFHYYVVAYLNSSYLGTFFSDRTVSILYVVGAAGSLLLFFDSPRMIRLLGIYRYLTIATMIEFATVFGLAGASSPIVILCLFIIYNAILPTIVFALDILLEIATPKESSTGKIRGIYLTISNATLVLSPLLMGFVIGGFGFRYAYYLSALFCIPLLMVAYSNFQKISTASPPPVDVNNVFKRTWNNKDIWYVTVAHFILQFFYVWMVIYLPIYLITIIGFSWEQLGLLFTIMLLPFILFEIPVGILADKKLGEKELMIFGFLLMACMSAAFALPTGPNFMYWAVLLFLSRVGASFVEITVESYFFKHVKGKDSDLISVFRMATEVAYIVAPLIAILSFSILPLGKSFWLLGCIVFFGSFAALKIKDTL